MPFDYFRVISEDSAKRLSLDQSSAFLIENAPSDLTRTIMIRMQPEVKNMMILNIPAWLQNFAIFET